MYSGDPVLQGRPAGGYSRRRVSQAVLRGALQEARGLNQTPTLGNLYIVSTPIGNLGDITYRAVEVLRQAALICAEDTRHTRALLERYGIKTPVQAYHEHNEARATPRLIGRLTKGDDIALVADAGTPLVSDPGARLVAAAIAAAVPVVPVPGPSALLAAVVASGLEATPFTFVGFLPRGGRERDKALNWLSALPHSSVLYESPNRVAGTLRDLEQRGLGERRLVVARELSKRFEEFRRGTVRELAAYYGSNAVRGEVVLVMEGGVAASSMSSDDELRERAAELRADGVSARDVVAALTGEFGIPRNRAYRIAHEGDR
ncbi:MAG: 16S rRNA (cytidine(1402)-2'-O)-methyltransferase [Gemmatimonadaceae bacterium]